MATLRHFISEANAKRLTFTEILSYKHITYIKYELHVC